MPDEESVLSEEEPADDEGYLAVEVGNSHAMEAYRNPGDETLYFRVQEPRGVERVSHCKVPRSLSLEIQVNDVIGMLERQIQPGEKPDWIDCAKTALTAALISHYDLDPKANHRPATWGRVPQ